MFGGRISDVTYICEVVDYLGIFSLTQVISSASKVGKARERKVHEQGAMFCDNLV